ncbi:MAG: hypothetical protein ABR542_09630 [Desulfonatronovibrio sp.]
MMKKGVRRLPKDRVFHSSFRIPIIAVTAHTQPGDRERFLEAGMDDYDYPGKPVKMEELEGVLDKLKPGKGKEP